MEKPTFTNTGAVVTASLASLCCAGPLVLAVIGGAGLGSVSSTFSVFEPYRPYFIGMTALFLGIGFFMTYRNRAKSCEENEACVAPISLKMRKVSLWSITGITALMLAVPYLPLNGTSVPVTDASLATTVLALEGMT